MIKCKNCNNENLIVESNGNQILLYCSECCKCVKQLSKEDFEKLKYIKLNGDLTSEDFIIIRDCMILKKNILLNNVFKDENKENEKQNMLSKLDYILFKLLNKVTE